MTRHVQQNKTGWVIKSCTTTYVHVITKVSATRQRMYNEINLDEWSTAVQQRI